jgi:uncharacterized protein (DUF111 family)
MTGPEHYRAAETLIESSAAAVNQAEDAQLILPPAAHWALAAAQVHATLALAAAFTEVGQSDNWQAAFEAGTGS